MLLKNSHAIKIKNNKKINKNFGKKYLNPIDINVPEIPLQLLFLLH